jgi:cysteine desulfurase/selenocysteine lyase
MAASGEVFPSLSGNKAKNIMYSDTVRLSGRNSGGPREGREDEVDSARIRKDFPIFEQKIHGRPLVYLDSAATAQKPRAVIEALDRFYSHDYSNVHRGVHALAERATIAYESARAKVADWIGAPADGVIWTRGTTEAINLVAYAWARPRLAAGDEIVVTEMEHHSNLVPWQLAAQATGAVLRFVPIRDDYTLDLDAYRRLLGPRTRLVAVSHMSNVLGTINPVREMASLAHAAGAAILVDAAQSAPHLPLNVAALDCDFLALSGHKAMGPTGIGVLYGKPEILNAMPPFHGGGEMIVEVGLERSTYKPAPHRFEAGTPPIAQAVGFAAAIDYLQEMGMENVAAHERDITTYALEALSRVEGLRVFGPKSDRGGAISFAVEGMHPHDLATILDTEAVAVRAGHHCAQPLMRRLGVPATVRASVYIYNRPEDLDALVRAIEKAKGVFGLARTRA